MQEGLVTVVVPVYKTEKYLGRCVASIINQTHSNLEIILVDDGSPDNCPQMCDEWAQKDNRIRVIHKENQGLGMARNTGIDNANGEYICFFDSDDYIAPETIDLAYTLARTTSADSVIFGLTSVDAQGRTEEKYVPWTEKIMYCGAEVQQILLPEMVAPDPETGISCGLPLSACCELISMEVIERASWRFVSEREIVSEDMYSIIALYAHIQKAVILPKALYYYCENQASISRTYRPDRYEKNKVFYQKLLELCRRNGYNEKVLFRCSDVFVNSVIAAMKQEVAHHERRTAVKRLKTMINDDLLQKVLWDKKKDKVNLKKRILFWAIRNRCYMQCYALLAAKNAAKK